MGKKPITEDILAQRLFDAGSGIEYVSGLVSTHKKALFKCHCGKFFETTPKIAIKSVGCKSCACKIARKHSVPYTDKFVSNLFKVYGGEIVLTGAYENLLVATEFMCSNNHTFTMLPSSVLKGRGCPACNHASDPRYHHNFQEEIHRLYGDRFDEVGDYVSSTDKVYVHCSVCDNSYYMFPHNLLRRGGCPYCSGIARKTKEVFEKQIQTVCGEKYTCVSYRQNESDSADIMCKVCGTVFSVSPSNFLRGQGCPACRDTKYESPMISLLNSLHVSYLHDKGIAGCANTVTGRLLRFDFIINDSKILIELDGSQHFIHIHKSRGTCLEDVQKRDEIKNTWARDNGWLLIRASDSKFRTERHLTFSDLVRVLQDNCVDGVLNREALEPYSYVISNDKFKKS